MYLKRKLDSFLQDWKQATDHKPLVIRGARQVGKTMAIRHFAEGAYKSVVEVNFLESPKYKHITEQGYSVESVVKMISMMESSHRFPPGKTLIFFDEIQEFPEIATALKFFCQDGRYDVICCGSMLGVQYKRIDSFSMGYKTDIELRSIDFEEFLWAHGYHQDMTDMMLERMLSTTPFSNGEMQRLTELFMDYVLLGGMPAVVADFFSSGNFQNTLSLQRQLILEYGNDIRKYTEGLDQARVMSVFESVPAQLAKENKKFQFSKIANGASSRDYWGCVEWLRDAGVVTLCHCLNFPELPLKGNIDVQKFKLYFSDTGFLVAMLDDEAQADLRANRNLGVYKGALFENLVGEALSKSGYPLYYYKREDSTLEQDFFVRDANHLYPVEVKATNGRSKSMRTLIVSDKYPDIQAGIKFALANIGHANNITTFPYFCAFLLKRYMQKREDTRH